MSINFSQYLVSTSVKEYMIKTFLIVMLVIVWVMIFGFFVLCGVQDEKRKSDLQEKVNTAEFCKLALRKKKNLLNISDINSCSLL